MIKKPFRKGLPLFLLLLIQGQLNAQLQLATIFGDSMVLQRNAPIKIWGSAGAGEQVTINFHQQQKKITADKNGVWKISLAPEKAGGPYTLQVKTKETITLNGILVGDVWICSGQSNMEFPMKGWSSVLNADEEIAKATHPSIRLFTVTKNVSALPANELKGGEWQTCTPANIPPFSAVAYYFGVALQRDLDVPIGLINSTWGGTQIEAWISHTSFEQSPYYRDIIKKAPQVSTDELIRNRQVKEREYSDLLKIEVPDSADLLKWPTIGYNDKGWSEMNLPGLWDYQPNLARLDGTVWFRKNIYLSEQDVISEASLHLGMVDDVDETYVNGVKVGGMNGWNINRVYTLGKGSLKAGDNVIAVRVDDSGGGGGIYGDTSNLFLAVNGKKFSLTGPWHYRVAKLAHNTNGVGANDYPSLLYNGMIHPFHQLAVKGVIWYQGEANATRAYEYRKAMPLLINDWRLRFGNGSMPFYYVQLASYNEGNGNSNAGSTWAELRESQALTLNIPQTGMAITTDIGESNDIHPRNKKDVGERLAALALKQTYGKNKTAMGPVYKSMTKNGQQLVLVFSNQGKGLVDKGNNGLKGFEIAGADRKFYPAVATIKNQTILLSAPQVLVPVAVRYAWSDDAGTANLFNQEGFPAAPFRTDNWPLTTLKNKYNPVP
ncbi:MAG: sialate O-acetylesterase [Chitinophagaceae bacterium]